MSKKYNFYADGGSTGLPAGAEQQFVNHYLNEGASAGIFEQGGNITDVTDAIFFPNQKNGKIKTSFGDKSKEGLFAMISNVNYYPEEISNAIFEFNEKSGKINTGFGNKTKEGLTEMIKSVRNTFAQGGSLVDGYLTDPNFGDFQAGVYDNGGQIDTKNITMAKRIKVKKWYLKTYPTDDLGKEIREDITFWSLWALMSQGYDVYNILGVGDSMIRERVFEELSKILGVDYDVIYQKWLNSDEYAQGGSTGLPEGTQQHFVNYYLGEGTAQGIFAEGGSLGNHGLKYGDQIIKTMSGGIQKVKTRSGDIVYVNLANGYRGAEPPLPFKNGGAVKKNLSRDRKFVNYSQDYEVRYSKDKPKRHGYTKPKMSRTQFEDESFEFFADGGKIRRFNRHEQMDSETREEILDVLSEPNTPRGLVNYLYGLFDGYDYSNTANFKKEMKLLKSKDSKLHDRVIQIYKKIDNYKFEKYGNYATGGGVDNDITYELENFNINNLDKFEIMQYNQFYPSLGKVGALQVLINNVEGDYSQLSEELSELAEKQMSTEEWNDSTREMMFERDGYATGGVTKNYINRSQLNTITIKKGDQKLTYKVSDVYNGAYKLEDGGNLEKTAFYVPKRNVVKVQLRDGRDVKVANGYWIKKGAKPIRASKYDDGGRVEKYEDWEMIVVSKELNKDGGRYIKDRFLVSAKNIEQAKEIATNLWYDMYGKGTDLSIVKVMSESLYELRYFDKYDDGGHIDQNKNMYQKQDLIRERYELLNDMYNNEETNVDYTDILKVGDIIFGDGIDGYARIEKEINDPEKGDYFIFQDRYNNKFALYVVQTVRDLYSREFFLQNVGISENDFLYSKDLIDVYKELNFHKNRIKLYKKNPDIAQQHHGINSNSFINSESQIEILEEKLRKLLFDERRKFEDGGQLEIKFAGGGKIETKIQKKVDEVNALIEKAIDSDGDPLMVVDTTGTWEEPMQYKPIVYKNGRLYIEYFEPYSGKIEKDVINKSNMDFDGYPTLLNIAKMYRKALKKEGISYAGGGQIKVGDDVKIIKSFPNADMTGKKGKVLELTKNNTGVIYILVDGKRIAVLSEYITKYEVGGKTTFKEKATAIAKNFEGKKVEPKYQKEYGKVYDKAEAKEVGNKIAGSQKAKYDNKMSGGGSTKRGGAMVLAKQIRKDGESWASALKRANEQMRKK